jgi:thiamine-monophosphate kinase
MTAETRVKVGRGDVVPARLARLLGAHLHPEPRLAQGEWLRKHEAATAAIDLSDGLSTDLAHICEESGVAAELEEAALPLGPGATLEQVLHGGEDYELLFTAGAGQRVPLRIAGVPVTRIGRIVPARKGRAQMMLQIAGRLEPLEPRGWQHFT